VNLSETKVATIGDFAFYNQNSRVTNEPGLETVRLPDTIEKNKAGVLGDRCFGSNLDIKYITPGASLTFENRTFSYDFWTYYSAASRAAGTYTHSGGVWTGP
jgi:hypothetical protein